MADAVNCDVESAFFLPQTLDNLEEQTCTYVKALELFTSHKGVAAKGCIHGLDMINSGRQVFKHFLSDNPLFAVKFAYLLDRVFPNFVDRLGDCCSEKRPIKKVRKTLEHS
jgi:hypothetical protein